MHHLIKVICFSLFSILAAQESTGNNITIIISNLNNTVKVVGYF